MYPHIMFLAKIRKNITIFHLKIIVFTAVKNCSILHGHVFVMPLNITGSSQEYQLAETQNFALVGFRIRNISNPLKLDNTASLLLKPSR